MFFDFFERLVVPFPKEEESVTPPRGFVKFVLFYTKGLWKYLFIVAIASSLVASGEALFFYYMGLIVDILTQTSDKELLFTENKNLWVFGSFALLVLVILPILSLINNVIVNQTIRSNSSMKIRYMMHRYMLRQSVGFFVNDFAGRLSQKVMQTAMAIRDCVTQFTKVIIHLAVYFVTMLWMLLDCHIYLVFVLLVWLVFYILIMKRFIPELRVLSSQTAEMRSSMVGRIVDSYGNIQTVKLFSRGNEEEEYAKSIMNMSLQADYRLMRALTKFQYLVQISNYLLIAILVGIAVILWSHSLLQVGAIALAFGLSIRINNLSQWVMWEIGLLFDNIGTVQNGMETIAKPIDIEDPKEPKQIKQIEGNISFRDVYFNYDANTKVFEGLNLNIKKGERVGIVGHSGGGKSSLVKILLRFYDVNSGSISLDGIDIRDLRQDDLRSSIAMVTQDVSLLHRSIKENILYGSNFQNLTEEEKDKKVREAAAQAKALDFIENLQDAKGHKGFDTQVGERGVRLSGGQRQRIAIARVILKNAPILVLDEATSALDSDLESAIKDNLNTIMNGKTVIAIAHRLSTIAAMDRLIVLNDGKIVEEGTHQELLALNGIYASLWKKQTDGFLGI